MHVGDCTPVCDRDQRSIGLSKILKVVSLSRELRVARSEMVKTSKSRYSTGVHVVISVIIVLKLNNIMLIQ